MICSYFWWLFLETTEVTQRESQATPPALSITFSKCQLPIQRLLENFKQNVVLQLTFHCLLFYYLMSFTTYWKKPQHYSPWSLQPRTLQQKILMPPQHLESITVSELLCEHPFQQAVGFPGSAACSALQKPPATLFLFLFSFILAMIVLLTTWLVFKHAVYGHKGTRSLCPYLWC